MARTKSEPITRLNRFTTLPVLLDLLQRKKLRLLDPKLWDDRNDSAVILEYKKRKKIKNLLALCFSHGDETVHHWKTFSPGNSGCVIEFNAQKLFKLLNNIPKLQHGKVVYKKLSEIENKKADIPIDHMPFTKRWPYRCEEEYRILVETNNNETFFDIDIPLSVINKITISQHMPAPVFATIKSYLQELSNNPKSRVSHSTLYENKRWINRFKKM